MAIGKRRPISFMVPTYTPEPGGGRAVTYTEAAQTFAAITILTKKSFANAAGSMQNVGEFTEFTEVRLDESFVPAKDMQVAYDGKLYQIVGIQANKNTIPFYYTITGQYYG